MSLAIQAGIWNDLGSGSNVDITVITKDGAEVLRNHMKPNERGIKEQSYKYPRGSTGIFSFNNIVYALSGVEDEHSQICHGRRGRCHGLVLIASRFQIHALCTIIIIFLLFVFSFKLFFLLKI